MKLKHSLPKQAIAAVVMVAVVLCLLPLLQLAGTAPNANAVGSLAIDGIDPNGKILAYGVDVSFWQHTVDFEALRDAGADFVILRAGYRTSADSYFEENYAKAKAAGLSVGAYWYSYALTPEEAYDEAVACLQNLAGKVFEYPVYLDYEDETQLVLDPSLSGEICTVFLDTLANSGYYAGLYSSISHLQNRIPVEPVQTKYQRWMAWYPNSGTYASFGDYCEEYGMWQYSSTGTVDGIDGSADMNICFADYPAITRANGLNGSAAALSGSTLMLRDATFPDTLCAGAPFPAGGTVSSTDGNITSLSVGFYSATGEIESGYGLHPEETEFDLSTLDLSSLLARLSEGTHYLRISATNDSQMLTLLNAPVHIIPDTFSVSGLTYPDRLPAGNTFQFRGSIHSSGGEILRLCAEILDDSGMVMADAVLTPEADTIDLTAENTQTLSVAALPAGHYRYCLIAENQTDTAVLLDREFVVLGNEQPVEASAYAMTETAASVFSLSEAPAAELQLVATDAGYYLLQSGAQVLTPENFGLDAGTRLIWAEDAGLACQQWQLLPAPDGGYYLLSRGGNVYLGTDSLADGFALSLAPVSYTLSTPVPSMQDAPDATEETPAPPTEPPLPESSDWRPVTDAAQLQIGDEILIVAAEDDFAMSCQFDATQRSAAAVRRSSGQLFATDEACVFTVCEGFDGAGIALYDAAAGGYLGNATAGNALRTYSVLSASTTWNLAIVNSTAILQRTGNTEGYLMFDRDALAFVCCDGAQQPIAIYYRAG